MIKNAFYLCTLIGVLYGCVPSSHEGHDHDHTDPVETITLFSDQTEIYAEYEPLETGKTNEFIVHVTNLEDYSPVDNARITISLIKGKKGIRQTVNSHKPGMFKAVLKPVEEGIYTLLFDLEKSSGNERFSIPGIRIFGNHEMIHDSITGEKSGLEITFLKSQAWSTDFAVTKVESRAFREVINTSGQLLSAGGDKSIIVAPHDGQVVLQQPVTEGRLVNSDEEILQITGEGLVFDSYRENYLAAKGRYELAKSNYERSGQLIEDKIITQREFDEACQEYKVAKAAFENLGTGTSNNATSSVLSAANGFIAEVYVIHGQFVEAGDPLLSIAKNQKLLLKADVSQNHWHCLPDIVSANFLSPDKSVVYSTEELNGDLVSYSRNASESAWSTPVYFEIDARPDIIPGSFVEVYLQSKAIGNVLAIPVEALTEEQGSHFVYVQLNGETFEKRQVKTGISNGSETEIISGLTEGERVVVRGAYQIKLASMSAAIPDHGHEH